MAELADALDLGSSGCIHASSSLVTRTTKEYAGVVELADTYDSGSYAVTSMQVQVLSPAPITLGPIGSGVFCFFFVLFPELCLQRCYVLLQIPEFILQR